MKTVTQALNELDKKHKGKIIEISNCFGNWWNYWNDEVQEIRITNKFIYVTVK